VPPFLIPITCFFVEVKIVLTFNKRMKQKTTLLFFFLLFCCTSTLAEESSINRASYLRFIKPQLEGIIGEYYALLKNMNPYYQELSAVHDDIGDLVSLYQKILVEVKFSKDRAKMGLLEERFFTAAIQLEEKIFTIIDIESFLIKEKKEGMVQNYFFIYPHIVEISQKLVYLTHLFSDASLIGLNESLFKKSGWDKIDKILWEVELLFEKVIYLSLDQEYENHFLMVWNEFFRIIQKQILPKDNINTLSSNLEQMNFAWNNFHKDMSKGGKFQDNRDLIILGNIHNRWNAILRLILVR
jgi:hypothetical protein